MTSLTLDQVDLENDVFAERVPHDTFALLRREAPVYWYDWSGGRGFWCVTKHEDVVAVSKDTKTFSSAQGANLEDLDEDARVARQSMLETDPPNHSRLRGLVGPPFTPRAVRAYEVALRELTREILDRALPHGRVRLRRGDRPRAADPRAGAAARRARVGHRTRSSAGATG